MLPADLRSTVTMSSDARKMFLARHPEHPCLVGFGQSRIDELEAEIEREERGAIARGTEFSHDRARRKRFSMLHEVGFDASGRFILPPLLAKVGRIEDQIFYYGNGPYFCLWNPDVVLTLGDDFEDEKIAVEFYRDELEGKAA